MDFGRDLKPDDVNYSQLSINSPLCPYHSESTAGGTFSFPPREQPTHAARRALIAAIKQVKDRNASIADPNQRDWVSIVAFDTVGAGTRIVQPLTGDYTAAMQASTKLQAVGDKGASTATEAGLLLAKQHLLSPSQGGSGRPAANKVVVLVTDGVPNAYVSTAADIDKFIAANPGTNFYNNGAYWLDAALVQAADMAKRKWNVFAVGTGLGADYDFLDRIARLGGTANAAGQSPRGTGNPAEYEQRLTDMLKDVIDSPKVRLVQ
jgi:hypothetical protein